MLRFHIRTTEIVIGIWFPAIILWMLLADKSGSAIGCLIASGLHECGHFAVMRWLGDPIKRVVLGLFGIRVERREGVGIGYTGMAAVSLAGPLANLLVGGVGALCGANSSFLLLNIALAAFHLLPIASLDGGEALYAILCLAHPADTAERIVLVVSVAILIPFGILGIFLLLRTGYNVTLLILTLYLTFLLILREKH